MTRGHMSLFGFGLRSTRGHMSPFSTAFHGTHKSACLPKALSQSPTTTAPKSASLALLNISKKSESSETKNTQSIPLLIECTICLFNAQSTACGLSCTVLTNTPARRSSAASLYPTFGTSSVLAASLYLWFLRKNCSLKQSCFFFPFSDFKYFVRSMWVLHLRPHIPHV